MATVFTISRREMQHQLWKSEADFGRFMKEIIGQYMSALGHLPDNFVLMDEEDYQKLTAPVQQRWKCGVCSSHGCETCHGPIDRCPCARDGRT